MSLFLPGLQITTGLLIVASLITGFLADPGSDSFLLHLLTALPAAIFSLFVHAMVMFYFIGSGKGIKDAIGHYGDPEDGTDYVERVRYFKKTVFPTAFNAILVTLAAGIIGGAVAGQVLFIPTWIHTSAAILAAILNLWAFPAEYRGVKENARLIHQLEEHLSAVQRRRKAEADTASLQSAPEPESPSTAPSASE